MRVVPGLVVLGVFALQIQGTVATFAPSVFIPDLVFLVVVGTAIAVGGAAGLLVAALLGYSMDVLTGALLGQHALLLTLAYAATRIANLRLNLLRPAPRAVLVAVLSMVYGLAHVGVGGLFGLAPLHAGLHLLGDLLIQAVLNAICAPAAVVVVQKLADLLLGDDEPTRRSLRVEPRGRVI